MNSENATKEERAAEEAARKACTLKHTKYQPTEAEFCCPKCGAGCGDFCVDESGNFECPDLHPDDGLVCMGKDGKGCPAEYGTSGQAFVTSLIKKKNLVPCTHCKGKGYVPGKKS